MHAHVGGVDLVISEHKMHPVPSGKHVLHSFLHVTHV